MRRRVPIRLQMTRSECAAACLAMVLSHHGRNTSVAECRDLMRPGRDGVSVSGLVRAGEAYGLVVAVDPTADAWSGPAVAYLSGHHFVVVERLGDRSVDVVDPARGRYRQSRAEFDAGFGGALVGFTPGPEFTRRRAPERRDAFLRYLREFATIPGGRRLLGLMLLLAAGLQGLGLVLPFATKVVVDDLVPAHRPDLLTIFGVAVLGTAFLQGVLTLLRSRTVLVLRARADAHITGRFVAHLLRLPLDFFLQRPRGDLLMRVGSVSSSREAITQQALTLGLDAVLLIGYLTALTFVAPWYTLVVAVLGLAQIGTMVASYRLMRDLSRRELTARTEEQSYLVEALQAILPVKANGLEPAAERRWRGLFTASQTAMLRRGRASAWFEGVFAALTVLAPLGLLWCGAWQVLAGRMSLGTMLAANSLALSVFAPMQAFVGAVQLVSMLRSQIERIYDVLDEPREAGGDRVLAEDRPAAVRATNITFRYAPQAPAVLSGVSFTVPAGAKIGIVGRTGSGKSTLAMLILGLLRPESGTIDHDGIPVESLDLGRLRSRCGAVLQELSLFNGTVRDNLTLGSPDATDDDVVTAARVAGLHDDVLRLPMGYRTQVGEGGSALSAGQRQRVALARALVHRPSLLILDESTSHLDPGTERRVDAALSALRVTRIVISHRLSAIRNAHEILVIAGGTVVARGRHDDLVRRPGTYRDLFGDEPASEPAELSA